MEYFCTVHNKKSLEYVCKQCDCVICCDCLLVGEHKGHDAIAFESACNVITKKCAIELEKEKDQAAKIKEMQDIVSQKVHKREEKFKLWNETVIEGFKKISEILKEKEKSILSMLEEEKNKEFGKYEKIFDEIKKLQAENLCNIEKLQAAANKKPNPINYKEYKEKGISSSKNYVMNLTEPFQNNKKCEINIENVLSAIDKITVLKSASDSIKNKPISQPLYFFFTHL